VGAERVWLAACLVRLFHLLALFSDVQPPAGGVPGVTGLADTANPMRQGKQLNKKQVSLHSLESGNESTVAGRSKSALFTAQKRVVLVKGIMQINPKLNFMPDWM
jgi:hypothetical protein